jgi:predicted RNA-binding Zn ribbon-like protein
MLVNPYGGGGAELAAALVNMAPAARPADVAAAMIRHGNTRQPPDAAQTGQLMEWARELSGVFGESDLARQVALVNRLLARSASRPRISQHDGRPPHLHYAPADCDTVAGLRAWTAAGLALVVCHDPGRLGRCAAADCGTVFVDISRNGRRRFCSSRCGTRVYVADHRGRRRRAGASAANL